MEFRGKAVLGSALAVITVFGCSSSEEANFPTTTGGAAGALVGGAGSGGSPGNGGAGGVAPGVGGVMRPTGGLPPVTGGVGPVGGTGGVVSPGSAPNVVQFTATPPSITQGQSVTFNVLVTDPDGAADVVGGSLTDPTGTLTYGNFTPQGGGAFTFAIDWTTLNALVPIEFTGQGTRQFKARFLDRASHSGEGATTLTLTCVGGAACAGACVNLTTDNQNCGACRKACPCVNGACGAQLGACFSQADGFNTCDAYCTNLNQTCVTAGCDGSTTFLYPAFDSCTVNSSFTGGAAPCANPLNWPTSAYARRCCCGG